jgi:F1F0 ATPase subunit 2
LVDTNLLISLFLAFVVGIAVGLFYFGGLWVTVRRLSRSRHPGLLMLISLIVRFGVTLGAFYLVMAGRWERLLVCVAGFLVVRIVLVRRWGPVSTPSAGP